MGARCVFVLLIAAAAAGQSPQKRNAEPKSKAQPGIRWVESGPGVVGVNPNQPYRPIAPNRAQSRETIFEFYLRVLNPRQIQWGDEIERRIQNLTDQSVRNPYFRLAAFETAVILLLMLVCWLWWDKMHQVKWVAAECLTDAITAKAIADQRAEDALDQYNRHIELCNRAIETQESGIPGGKGASDWQREIRELQETLTTERSQRARAEAELKNREEMQAQLEWRLSQMEATMQQRREGANSELVARLQRAEAELAGKKNAKK